MVTPFSAQVYTIQLPGAFGEARGPGAWTPTTEGEEVAVPKNIPTIPNKETPDTLRLVTLDPYLKDHMDHKLSETPILRMEPRNPYKNPGIPEMPVRSWRPTEDHKDPFTQKQIW